MTMTRTSYRPLAAIALAVGILAYVGCNSHNSSEPPAPAHTLAITKAPAVPPDAFGQGTKLFADWPKPAGALLISGEQDGYTAPCGCTSGQLGGLRRRYDLIERIHTQGWPLALIDLGSLIKDPAGAREGPEQVKLTLDISLRALVMMKYDALALSARDLKIGVADAFGHFLNLSGHPRVVVANVTPAAGVEKVLVPSLRTSAGPIKLGITAVIDPEALNKLSDDSKELFIQSTAAPEQVLPEVLADLEKDTDTQVLMVQGPPEMAKALAGKFPGFDIVVSTSHFDPSEDAERLNDGKTLLVSVGKKGKYVGVIGLFQDAKPKYRYQRVSLISRFNGAAEPMRKLIEDEFQSALKQQGVVENFPRRGFVGGTPGAQFVGVDACKGCHPKTVAFWATTKHAHAFDDIVKDPHGERSDHQFDAECVSCHTTGFEYHSGWVSAEKTPSLKGNQCENCHGPSSKHAEDPDNKEYQKAVARNAADLDKNAFCIRCHDEDNSPKFNFANYWGKIVHKRMDSYDDPKVHQGVKANVAHQDAK
jgi:hypothetical protein